MNPSYFSKRNGQGAENHGIEPAMPGLKDALADLLSDPEILHLHRKSVDRHLEKIEELKQDPDFAEIWAGILEELGQRIPALAERAAVG